MKCGLLGEKLGHSYSPQIHALLGNYSYELFERKPSEIEDFLKNGDWEGINVTVPYKKTVIPYLDQLTPIAQKLGAVNTIVRRNGKLIGHNTDYFGFQTLLDSLPISVCQEKALILGSGGASNTAAAVLKDLGADVVIISRNGENNYSNLQQHKDAHLIVNTTPVGMYPNTGTSPLSGLLNRNHFPSLKGIVDVIYNPARTQLLLDAENYGSIAFANGLLMLVAQAKEASEWFTGSKISNDVIEPIMDKLERQMHNIILVGMPGCGKSTVGKLLSEQTGLKFVDADDEIVRLSGKTIPDIFTQDGEFVFRKWETAALAALGKESGLIIATGGGCVTQDRNYDLLHQNGDIYWIQRRIDDLDKDGRPMSQNTDLNEMYRIRKPMYERFRDWDISNNTTPEDAVRQIIEIWEKK
jgi:shikimate dehydrogenase